MAASAAVPKRQRELRRKLKQRSHPGGLKPFCSGRRHKDACCKHPRDPFFLRKEEFEALRNFKPAKTLEETKEAFLLHCALGCRIGDFQRYTMDNVGVSEEGIPYIHNLPEKTKGTQKDNSETVTPLARSTHVDMMNKVQINIYAAGLHRQGSGAVTHYTMLELADRFKLMNLAFNQEDYRVDKNLEVI